MNTTRRSFFTKLSGCVAALGLTVIAPALAICGPTVVSVETEEGNGEEWENLTGGLTRHMHRRTTTKTEHLSDGTTRRWESQDVRHELIAPDGSVVSMMSVSKPFRLS